MIDVDQLPKGAEITVLDRGRYTYHGCKTTSAGRVVVTICGPVDSAYKAFGACYLEDVIG